MESDEARFADSWYASVAKGMAETNDCTRNALGSWRCKEWTDSKITTATQLYILSTFSVSKTHKPLPTPLQGYKPTAASPPQLMSPMSRNIAQCSCVPLSAAASRSAVGGFDAPTPTAREAYSRASNQA